MPQQRGRAWVPVSSCPQLWVGAAFPGCQQGMCQAASGFTMQHLQCSAIPQFLAQSILLEQGMVQPVSIWGLKYLLQHLLVD